MFIRIGHALRWSRLCICGTNKPQGLTGSTTAWRSNSKSLRQSRVTNMPRAPEDLWGEHLGALSPRHPTSAVQHVLPVTQVDNALKPRVITNVEASNAIACKGFPCGLTELIGVEQKPTSISRWRRIQQVCAVRHTSTCGGDQKAMVKMLSKVCWEP